MKERLSRSSNDAVCESCVAGAVLRGHSSASYNACSDDSGTARAAATQHRCWRLSAGWQECRDRRAGRAAGRAVQHERWVIAHYHYFTCVVETQGWSCRCVSRGGLLARGRVTGTVRGTHSRIHGRRRCSDPSMGDFPPLRGLSRAAPAQVLPVPPFPSSEVPVGTTDRYDYYMSGRLIAPDVSAVPPAGGQAVGKRA